MSNGVLDGTDESNATNDNVNLVSNIGQPGEMIGIGKNLTCPKP